MGLLFILFPGFRENAFTYYSRKQFLEKLKKLGSVFCCENKVYNLGNRNTVDDLEVSDFNPNQYLKTVYSQIMKTVPGAKTLEWIPIGHSLGGYQAVGFSQIYSRKCSACILLDPLLFTNPNISEAVPAFHSILETLGVSTKITQKNLQHIRNQIQTANKTQRQSYIDYLQYVYAFQLVKWAMQNITDISFKKPVYSFVNITEPGKSGVILRSQEQALFDPFFTNQRKRVEISVLETDPNFHYKVYLNQTHHLLHIPDVFHTIQNVSEGEKK